MSDADLIHLMVVDDSAVIRGLISRALADQPRIKIVATAANGQAAIDTLKQQKDKIDVITLDIEMPVMDGITALPQLRDISPQTHVIMVSTLTARNAEITLEAQRLGAVDYVPKPSTRDSAADQHSFYAELTRKILALGEQVKQKRAKMQLKAVAQMGAEGGAAAPATVAAVAPVVRKAVVLDTKKHSLPVKALGVASSTGGPQALMSLFKQMDKEALKRIPTFITQHMPATFTNLLAQHISRDAGIDCVEAADGMAVQAGRVYVAPGDYHMEAADTGSGIVIKLNQSPPINFCRPSADPMLSSLANLYGRNLMAVVLTGMGSDGLNGCYDVRDKGGFVVAQDEATSVVWGMPRAVAEHKLCEAVLPLNEIAPYIGRALERR
jgi:two-component system chemotaxis response regulator CheB